eukprot:851721_1
MPIQRRNRRRTTKKRTRNNEGDISPDSPNSKRRRLNPGTVSSPASSSSIELNPNSNNRNKNQRNETESDDSDHESDQQEYLPPSRSASSSSIELNPNSNNRNKNQKEENEEDKVSGEEMEESKQEQKEQDNKNKKKGNKKKDGRKGKKTLTDDQRKDLLESAIGAQWYSGNRVNSETTLQNVKNGVTFNISTSRTKKELTKLNKEYIKIVSKMNEASSKVKDGSRYTRAFLRTQAGEEMKSEWFKFYDENIGGDSVKNTIKAVESAADVKEYEKNASAEARGRRLQKAKTMYGQNNAKQAAITDAATSIAMKNGAQFRMMQSHFIKQERESKVQYAKCKGAIMNAYVEALQGIKQGNIIVEVADQTELKKALKSLSVELQSVEPNDNIMALYESLKNLEEFDNKGEWLVDYLISLNLEKLFGDVNELFD